MVLRLEMNEAPQFNRPEARGNPLDRIMGILAMPERTEEFTAELRRLNDILEGLNPILQRVPETLEDVRRLAETLEDLRTICSLHYWDLKLSRKKSDSTLLFV